MDNRKQVRIILEDWKLLPHHGYNRNDEEAIIDAVLDAIICGNCSLGIDGVCKKA